MVHIVNISTSPKCFTALISRPDMFRIFFKIYSRLCWISSQFPRIEAGLKPSVYSDTIQLHLH